MTLWLRPWDTVGKYAQPRRIDGLGIRSGERHASFV